MKITLYYAPYTCSTVPSIVLQEAKAKFEVVALNTRNGDQFNPRYLSINPKGKVPALAVDEHIITENISILQWIADTYEEAALLPKSGFDRYKAISFMAWCATGMHPYFSPNVHPERYCDMPGSEDGVRRCAQKFVHKAYRLAETALDGRDWFLDHFSIPDAYFYWAFRSGELLGFDQSPYPACRAHFERMSERESVKRTLEMEAEYLGSGLVDHSQKSTVAARARAEKKTVGQRS